MVCGVEDCPTNLLWCWDEMGQSQELGISRFAGKLTVHHGFYVRLGFRGISLVRVNPKNIQILQLK